MNKQVRERLNTNVSYFTSVYNQEADKIITLKEFLKTVALDTYLNQVATVARELNKESRRKLKTSLLPSVTVPGVFHPTRKIENLIDVSGVIAIDIDPPEDLPDLKQQEFAIDAKDSLIGDKYVLAMHFTASYRGIVVYFMIPHYTDNLPAEINFIYSVYYKSISNYLWENYKIPVDAAPKSIASLRFLSFDRELHLNVDAELYNTKIPKIIPKVVFSPESKTSVSSSTTKVNNSSIEAVYNLTDELIRQKIDITAAYHQWLRISYGIASSFGEKGRDVFHRISSIYPAYRVGETNRMYDNALSTSSGRVTVATVFKLAFDAGIDYKRNDKRF